MSSGRYTTVVQKRSGELKPVIRSYRNKAPASSDRRVARSAFSLPRLASQNVIAKGPPTISVTFKTPVATTIPMQALGILRKKRPSSRNAPRTPTRKRVRFESARRTQLPGILREKWFSSRSAPRTPTRKRVRFESARRTQLPGILRGERFSSRNAPQTPTRKRVRFESARQTQLPGILRKKQFSSHSAPRTPTRKRVRFDSVRLSQVQKSARVELSSVLLGFFLLFVMPWVYCHFYELIRPMEFRVRRDTFFCLLSTFTSQCFPLSSLPKHERMARAKLTICVFLFFSFLFATPPLLFAAHQAKSGGQRPNMKGKAGVLAGRKPDQGSKSSDLPRSTDKKGVTWKSSDRIRLYETSSSSSEVTYIDTVQRRRG